MCHKIPVEVEILNVLTDNINIYAIHASNTMFDSRRCRRRFRVWLDRRFRKIVAFRDTRYSYRSAIKCRVIKLQIVLSEVQNGEIHLGLFLSITLVLLLDASSSPNDLLKLRHRTYNTVQSNNLTGLSIDACAHQTARNGNYRIFRRWVNKVVQLGFTDLIIARDLHDIARILCNEVSVLIFKQTHHLLTMRDVLAKNDGLGISHIVCLHKVTDTLCYHLTAFDHNDF